MSREKNSDSDDHTSEGNVGTEPVANDATFVQELFVQFSMISVKKGRAVLPQVRRGTDQQKEHEDGALEAKNGAHFRFFIKNEKG